MLCYAMLCQVVASKKPGGFWVLTNNRSLELLADDEKAAVRWMGVLQDTANQVPDTVQTGPAVRGISFQESSSSSIVSADSADSFAGGSSQQLATVESDDDEGGVVRQVEVHKPTPNTLLGIGFADNPAGAGVVVSELHPTGLLAQSGAVAVGDVLLSVNGTHTNAPDQAGTQLQGLSGRLCLRLLSQPEPGPPPPVRQSKTCSNRHVRCVYAYNAQEEDELTICVGEVIELICDEGGWWVGRVGDTVGTFPHNYVEEM